MNMKKTIAAIAAASLAVSATVATVSAEEAASQDYSFKYNLVYNVKKVQKTPLTMTAYYDAAPMIIDDELVLAVGNTVLAGTNASDAFNMNLGDAGKLKKITITGNYIEDGRQIRPIVFTTNKGDADYNPDTDLYKEGTGHIWEAEIDVNNKYTGRSILSIPIVDNYFTENALMGKAVNTGTGGVVTADSTTIAVGDAYTISASADAVTIDGSTLKNREAYSTTDKAAVIAAINAVSGGLADGTYVINASATTNYDFYTIDSTGSIVTSSKKSVTGMTSKITAIDKTTFSAGDFIVVTIAKNTNVQPGTYATVEAANMSAFLGKNIVGTHTLTSDGTDWFIDIEPKSVTGAKAVSAFVKNAAGTAALSAGNAGDTITFTYDAAASDTLKANITVTVEWTDVDSSKAGYENLEKLNQGRIGTSSTQFGVSHIVDGLPQILRFNNAYNPESKTYEIPLKTTPTNTPQLVNTRQSGYLETLDLNKVGNNTYSYYNVMAVLNDAIKSGGDVNFTFNTVQSGVKFAVMDRGYDDDDAKVVTDGYKTYDAAVAAAGGDASKVRAYKNSDNDANTTYTTFGDVAYWSLYDTNSTVYYYDVTWASPDLFAGALIANDYYSMQLYDTTQFDWSKSSITFAWSDLAGDADVTDPYSIPLTSLKLATSTAWFWEDMTVTVAAAEAEDVTTGEGVEVEDDVLDDEAGEDITEEDLPEEEPEAEPEEEPEVEEPEPEPEVVEEPVAETNPKTGNSAVALAVIPVALAAAAVVAKKRS